MQTMVSDATADSVTIPPLEEMREDELAQYDVIASPAGTAAKRLAIHEAPLVSPGTGVRAVFRLIVYLGITIFMAPVQGLALALRVRPLYRRIPRVYHRICCRILGLRLTVRGKRHKKGPVLFVSNHISYLDIGVLGALIPGSFVAKAEISGWPVFGWLAKMQRTVFVDRQRRSTAGQRDSLSSRLDQGDSLILFPEGTSSDGNRVLPFKSALFSVAAIRPHDKPLKVQPVSIAYTRLDGMPIGRNVRPFFAWYGDMEMHDHLWDMARLGVCDVEVRYHEPVTLEMFANRKAMAEHCHALISQSVSRANSGREDNVEPPQGQDDGAADGDDTNASTS